jgi:hypothetical protein
VARLENFKTSPPDNDSQRPNVMIGEAISAELSEICVENPLVTAFVFTAPMMTCQPEH